MTNAKPDLRDACRLLGGLMLEGARPDLLRELQRESIAARLGAALGGHLGDTLLAMQGALDGEDAEALATEYTRLLVASAHRGARSPLLVPPWEDCYSGEARRVHGERSRAALRAYAEASLGFDGLKEEPADHIGLQLCFLAALLDEEEQGERDSGARARFFEDHVRSFFPVLGKTLAEGSEKLFWREAGHAIAAIPEALGADVQVPTAP